LNNCTCGEFKNGETQEITTLEFPQNVSPK